MAGKTLENHLTIIYPELCKGCGLCIEACPQDVLKFHEKFNSKGFHYAYYVGDGCTGCNVCFYACPEPEAVAVYKKGHILLETEEVHK
jgi:NAD-dependent dihydropyrimidine dehydrogenase PreA subunit